MSRLSCRAWGAFPVRGRPAAGSLPGGLSAGSMRRHSAGMIVLFTDFGPAGPYLGQMKAVLARDAPGVAVIDLLSDAPAFDARDRKSTRLNSSH